MKLRAGMPASAALLLAAVLACGPEAPHEAFPREGTGGHGAEAEVHDEDPVATGGEAHPPEEHDGGGGHGPTGFPEGPVGHVDDFAVDGVLRSIPAAPAVETAGPGGTPFRVALRTPVVGHYPCTSCHVRPIGSKEEALMQMHGPREEHEGATRIDCDRCHDPARPGGYLLECTQCHEREGLRELMPSRTAHLTVDLSHPSGADRNCLTCHAPEDPGMLVLRDGRRAGLDEAYRLCRGCHFMQGTDWAAGSHGKRLGGWAGERTILSCTGCHNPHSPQFPVRKPVTFPKIARPGESR
jgi:hypothetical protein